jgi:hypothetical protein
MKYMKVTKRRPSNSRSLKVYDQEVERMRELRCLGSAIRCGKPTSFFEYEMPYKKEVSLLHPVFLYESVYS